MGVKSKVLIEGRSIACAWLALNLAKRGAEVHWNPGSDPTSLRPARLEGLQWGRIQDSISDPSMVWVEPLRQWGRVFGSSGIPSERDPLLESQDLWVDRVSCLGALEKECSRARVKLVDQNVDAGLHVSDCPRVDLDPKGQSLFGMEMIFDHALKSPAHRLELRESMAWIFEPLSQSRLVLTLLSHEPLRVGAALSALEKAPLGALQALFVAAGPRPPQVRKFQTHIFRKPVPSSRVIPLGQAWGQLGLLDNRVESRAIQQADRLLLALSSGRMTRQQFVRRQTLSLQLSAPLAQTTHLAHVASVPAPLARWALGFMVPQLRRAIESPV
jgi:hypothetical protein